MKIEAKNVEDYLSKAGQYESELREVDAVIRKNAPNLKPVLTTGMASTMIGYGNMPYKPKSAKVASEWPLVLLAAQKNYMALYLCATTDGQYVAEKYESQLGKVSVGKSCVRFKKLEDLNLDTVKIILKDLDKRFLRGEKAFN